jgi:diketogulonate reductase-like aldo/keto reductase
MDLCLIHQVNEDFPLKKTIRALDRLVDGKLVRNIGVSNFKVERLREAQAHSDNKIAVNQVHYSLVCREPEPELLPFCQSNDIILQAWRPLQGEGIVKNTCGIVKTMCEKYSATPSQIALAWLIAQPNVTTMSTMRSPEHLRENADCVRIKLDPEDVERLRREFPGRQTVSFAVPLK